MTPMLTIALVAYNEEKYIGDTIQSLLNQTYRDFVLRIYNHASTDSTGEIAEHYAKQDPRVQVIHLPVNNSMQTYFHVMQSAESPFFMGAAGHDLYDPKYIEMCMQPLLEDRNIVLSYTRAAFFKDAGLVGPIYGNFHTMGMEAFPRSLVVGYGLVYAYQCYGIYRLPVYKQLTRNTCVGFDHVMLAELALFGTFHEHPETLFFMRQLDDHNDLQAYKKKHHGRDAQDGHRQFMRTTQAYMEIANRISSDTDRDLLKLAFFTQALIRNRNILDMYGCSIDSFLATPEMIDIRRALGNLVKNIESNFRHIEQPQSNTGSTQSAGTPKIAGEGVVGKDLTEIQKDSEFELSLKELIRTVKPNSIIETGTYLGKGTTRVVAEAIRESDLTHTTFYSIECNPGHHQQARTNLAALELTPFVQLKLGLSVPRRLLPTVEQIHEFSVVDVSNKDIFVDHQAADRAAYYFKETDFPNVEEDLLGRCIDAVGGEPDILILDSGGHMGHVEFNYVLQKLRRGCYFVLDDIRHLKHHESFALMQRDPRFQLLTVSDEKFGFCIARFEPGALNDNPDLTNQQQKGKEILSGKEMSSGGLSEARQVGLMQPRVILWVRTDSIGDNVLASSMIRPLRDHYPASKIVVLCQQHNAELYEACPFIDQVIAFDRGRSYADDSYRAEIVKRVRAVNPDLALNTVFSREPLTDYFTTQAGASVTVAWAGDFANGMTPEWRSKYDPLYTHILSNTAGRALELDRHHAYLAGVGIDSPALEPEVWINEADVEFADSFMQANGLDPAKTIALFPGAQHIYRVYPNYGQALSRFTDHRILILGSESDLLLANNIAAEMSGRCVVAAGKTSLRQMAALISKCLLFVGSESAGAHIACAVGTPNVVMLGGGHFSRFMPYSPLTSAVSLPLECFGCDWLCKYQHAHCVTGIVPNVLEEAITSSLGADAKRPRVFVQGAEYWPHRESMPEWSASGNWIDASRFDVIAVGNIPESEKLRWAAAKLRVEGDWDGSATLLQKARLYDSHKFDVEGSDIDQALALNDQGEKAYADGHIKEAIASFNGALEIAPNYAVAHNNLAAAYFVNGDIESAAHHVEKALELAPDDREIVINSGQILKAIGFNDVSLIYERYLSSVGSDQEIEALLHGVSKRKNEIHANSDVLVSAIVSTYNAEKFIRGCLEDLEAQTIADRMEIIVVDTGSPQREGDIIRAFQQKYGNIKYIRTEHRETVYQAWNRGIRAARGKYITNANTDDRHRRDGIEILVDTLERDPSKMLAYGDSVVTVHEGETYDTCTVHGYLRWPDFDRKTMLDFCYMGPHPVWRKTLHDTIGFFDERYECAADYDFWLRAAQMHDFIHVRELVGLYWLNEGTVSRKGDLPIREANEIIEKYRVKYAQLNQYVDLSQKSLKILMVSHSYLPLSRAGVEMYTAQLSQALLTKGHTVHVYHPIVDSSAQGRRLVSDIHIGVTVHRLITPPCPTSFYYSDHEVEDIFSKLLEREEYDVVHFQHLMNSPISLLELASAQCAVKMTVHDHWYMCARIHLVDGEGSICTGPDTVEKCTACVMHGIPEAQRADKHDSIYSALTQRKNAFQRLLSNAGNVSFPSNYLQDKHAEYLNYQGGNVTSLGVPQLSEIRPRTERTGPIKFVYIGNVYPVKNTLFLAKVFTQLKHDARLLIWGAHIPGEYWDELAQLVNQDQRIALFGAYESSQLSTILAEADVVIVPSLMETYSLTIREALMHGIPVFASNVGAIPEIVRHLDNGVLFNPLDQMELLKWMKKAIEEPGFLAQLGKSSTTIASIDSDANQWEASYRQALLEHPKRFRKSSVHAKSDTTAEDIAYQNWIKKHSIQEIDAQLLAERMVMKWHTKPTVHFIVKLAAGNESLLADVIDSLAAQMYPQWRLTVIADFPSPSTIFTEEESLCWIHLQSTQDLASSIDQAVSSTESDWLCVMPQGTVFSPQFLVVCADYINLRPQWKLIYTDEDEIDEHGIRTNPIFKPDFNLDLLRSMPYMGLMLVERKAFIEVGGFSRLAGAESYDLALRLLDEYGEKAIGHIADVLSHVRKGMKSIHDDRSAMDALAGHLQRNGEDGEPALGYVDATYHIIYRHAIQPMITVIIPNRNKLEFLQPCVESLFEKTAYLNYEVIIVDNQSDDPDVLEYYEDLRNAYPDKLRVIFYNAPFNFSAMNNIAAREAEGDYLLLLNNDTQIVQPEWMERLLNHGLRHNVGAVGARCVYPESGKLQHAGIILGMTNVADHPFNGELGISEHGYMKRALVDQNYSAVTAACMLVRKSAWNEVGGMDEDELQVLYNDVDLCLKLSRAGYKVVWTPYSTVVHHGTMTIKDDAVDLMQLALADQRGRRERAVMLKRWMPSLAHDPAYNPHLTLHGPGYRIEGTVVIDWDRHFHDRPRILSSPLSGGSGEYRVTGPFRALSRAGLAHCDVIQMGDMFKTRVLTTTELARAQPDSLVVQAAIDNKQMEALTLYKEFNSDVLRVFTLDDLLTQVPKQNSFYRHSFKDAKPRLRKALALCDRAIVTTEPLAELCQSMIGDVRLIPNRLERAIWSNHSSRRRHGSKPRVGWAGAQQHAGDLVLIAEAVMATAQEVDWVFFGMCPDELRPFVRETHDFVLSFYDYPAKLASLNLDLAIAPLDINLFNEAKSNLRLLEYGIMGWPVVCTDIYPYQNAPVTRVTNDTQAWIKAIRDRIYDLDAAEKEGDALKQWVLNNYMLEDHLDEWLSALTR